MLRLLSLVWANLGFIDIRLWVIWVLYLIGIVHWIVFFQLGTPQYSDFFAYDWPYIHQWLAVTELAIITKEIPFHVTYYADSTTFGHRFFASPFLMASPQILALPFLDFLDWVTMNVILLYSLGFYGLAKWIYKLDLSPYAAAFLIIMFCFNGFHSGRLAVGHIQNLGYFLIPWLFWIINNFLESNNQNLKNSLLLALQLGFFFFLVLLQGSSVLIPNMFLAGLFMLFHQLKRIPWYLLGSFIGFILSSYIVWPNLLFSVYISPLYSDGVTNRTVFYGFSGDNPWAIFNNVFGSLALVKTAAVDAYWSQNTYISILGVVLVFLCLLVVFQNKTLLRQVPISAKGALIGVVLLGVLSMIFIYRELWALLQLIYPFPAIDRLPTRLIIYPLTYSIIIGALGFDALFGIIRFQLVQVCLKISCLIGLLALLMQHSWVWRFENTVSYATLMPGYVGDPGFAESIFKLPDDGGYIIAVGIAYLVSMIALFMFGGLYVYIKRRLL